MKNITRFLLLLYGVCVSSLAYAQCDATFTLSSGTAITTCSLAPFTITAATNDPNVSYFATFDWSPNVFIANAPTTGTTFNAPSGINGAGTFTIDVTCSVIIPGVGGCTETQTITVTVVSPTGASNIVLPATSCQGGSTPLTVTNYDPTYTYSWYQTANNSTAPTFLGTGYPFNVTPNYPSSNYEVRVTTPAGSGACISGDTRSVYPLQSTTDYACVGTGATLSTIYPTGNVTGNWTNAAGFVSNNPNNTVVTPPAGKTTYFFSGNALVFNPYTGQSSWQPVSTCKNMVIEDPEFSLSYATIATTNPCISAPTLSATATPQTANSNLSYHWTDLSNPNFHRYTATIHPNLQYATTLSVTSTASHHSANNQCTATHTIAIPVSASPPPPQLTVSGPGTVCSSNQNSTPITFTASGMPAGTTYVWQSISPSSQSIGTGNPLTLATPPTVSTNYLVTATTPDGCTYTAYFHTPVYTPAPFNLTASAGYTPPCAYPNSHTISVGYIGNTSGASFQWYEVNNGIATLIPTSGSGSITVTTTTPKTYRCIMSIGGCSQASNDFTLTPVFNNSVPVSIASDEPTGCVVNTNPVNLSANSTAANVSYLWSYNNATTQNITVPAPSVSEGLVSYSVTATVTNGSNTCSSIAYVSVGNVHPVVATCINVPLSMQPNVPSLYMGPNGGFIMGGGYASSGYWLGNGVLASTLPYFTITPTSTMVVAYEFTGQAEYGEEYFDWNGDWQLNIFHNPHTECQIFVAEDPSFTPPANVTTCAGQSVNLSVSNVASSGTTFNWVGGANPLQGNSVNVSPFTTTTYNITSQTPFAGCQDNHAVNVAITGGTAATPTISGNLSICAGSGTTLTVNNYPANSTFLWMPGAFTTASINVNPSVTTTYTCTVSPPLGTCDGAGSATATVTITVPCFTIGLTGNSTVCEFSDASLAVTGAPNLASYEWTAIDQATGFPVSLGTGPNGVLNLAAGTYVISVIVTDMNTMATATASMTVTILPLVPITITANPNTVCRGQNVGFTATSTNSSPNFIWTINGNPYPQGDGLSAISYNTSSITAGSLFVTVSDNNNNGCPSEGEFTLPITQGSPISLTAGPACDGGSSILNFDNGDPASTYSVWVDGNQMLSNQPYSVWGYSVGGFSYPGNLVEVQSTNSAGCISTTSQYVPVPNQVTLTVPPTQTVCSGQTISLTLSTNLTSNVLLGWFDPLDMTGQTFLLGATYTGTIPTTNFQPYYQATAVVQHQVDPNNTSTWCTRMETVLIAVNAAPSLTITNPAAVCAPATIDLTDAAIIAGSDLAGGTLSYWEDAAATLPVANPSAIITSGVYYIKVTNTCGSVIQPVTITIHQLPTLTITHPAAVCAPNTVDLTAAAVTVGSNLQGGTLEYWTNSGGTTPLANPNAVGTSGTYYISVAATAPCTSVIMPVVVTIHPLPTLIITSPAPVCAPSAVNLTAASVTAGSTLAGATLSYWADVNATIPLNNPNVVTVSGVYYIKLSNSNCSEIKPVTVVVNTPPSLNITPPTAVCSPNVVDLTAASVTTGSNLQGGTLQYWTNSAGTIPLSNPTAVGVSGTYYISVTGNAPCARVIKPVIVTINPLPTLVVTNPPAVCAPATVNLAASTITAGSSSGTRTYFTDAALTNTFNGVVNTSGTYYIRLTSSAGCSVSAPVVVTINTPPTLTVTSPAAVCSPNTINLTLPSVTAGSNLQGGTLEYWTNSTGTIPLNNPSAVSASGTYYISVTATAPCSRVIKAVTVTINPLPTLVITNPPAVCAPTTVNLAASTITAGSSSGTRTYFTDAALTNAFNGIVNTSGTYYIRLTSSAGCSVSAPVIVTIHTLPTLTITPPAAVCSPNTVDLTAAAITAGSNLQGGTLSYWTNAAATIPLTNPAAIGVSGTYYIRVAGNAPCASVIKPVVVTIYPTPTISTTGSLCVCQGGTTNITATANITPVTFAWYAGSVSPANLVDSDATLNVSPTTATNYIVVATTANGCSASTTVNVMINLPPAVSITANTTGCSNAGDVVTLTAAGATNYVWTSSPAVPFTVISSNQIQYVVQQANVVFSVSGTNTGSNTCPGTANFTVSRCVNSCNLEMCYTVGNLQPSGQVAVSFTATGGTSGINTYSWVWGDGTYSSGYSSQATTTHDYNPTTGNGMYEVVLYVQNNGVCCQMLSRMLNTPRPCTIPNAPVFKGFTYQITMNTAGNAYLVDYNLAGTLPSGYTATWSFGANAPSNVIIVGGNPNAFSYTTGGRKNVCLTLTQTATGCTEVICMEVSVPNPPCFVEPHFTATVCTTNPLAVNFSTNAVAGASYNWNFGGAGTSVASTTQAPTFTYSNYSSPTAPYQVTLTKTIGACAASATYRFHIQPFSSSICPAGTNKAPSNTTSDEIELIPLENTSEDIQLIPNPTESTSHLIFNLLQSEWVQVEVFSLEGRKIWASQEYFEMGEHAIAIDTDTWADGVYLVKFHAAQQTRATKLIVNH